MTIRHIVSAMLLSTALAGCMTDEERMAQLNRADDITCQQNYHTVPGSQQYMECRKLITIERDRIGAQDAAAVAGMGTAMQNAGQALQGIYANQPPPPPPTMTCTHFPGSPTTTCN